MTFQPLAMRALSLDQISKEPAWEQSFAHVRKDRRYYEIVETSLNQGFEHGYLLLESVDGKKAVQPYFVLDQDVFQGSAPRVTRWAQRLRKIIPRLGLMRTLMVGCAAGEAHLDCDHPDGGQWIGEQLSRQIRQHARSLRCGMIVMKEFPARYRSALAGMKSAGFGRIPSMPMVLLDIDYADFEEYMAKALSKATRKDLRRKFKATADGTVELSVVGDIGDVVDEIYPLYLAVFERSDLHFEKLTKSFFTELSRRMPDKVRYFLWRKNGKMIAFSLCMLEGRTIYDEYLGLDYSVALELHLYFHTLRDILSWAMKNGFKSYCSSALNYEPKLHLKCTLVPLDLYVTHRSKIINWFMQRFLPLLEPTRNDPTLKKFPNYDQLWGTT